MLLTSLERAWYKRTSMNAASSTTTTDIDGIRQLLGGLLAERKDSEVVDLVVALLQQLSQDNRRLQQRLEKLLLERFVRKSEKIPAGQLRLFLEEALAQAASDPADAESAEPDAKIPAPIERLKKKRSKPTGRRPFPADLPREGIVLEPSAEEQTCPLHGAKVPIGHERSEMLDWVPGHFKVLVQLRAKYACRPCQGEISIAPVALKPIDAGVPGFGLLADVLVKKYADHCPLHRIRGIYRRHGVDLPVSTLSHWVGAGSEILEPIARAIRRETLASHVVQADDTGLRVLDPAKKGGTKRGHMWSYVGDQVWVTFDYTPTWEGEGPCTFLADRHGWLQADAYAGYDRLFRGEDATAVEVGCWAHARRYYFDALPSDRRAGVALAWIGKLYEVEREAKERGLDPLGVLALRLDKSKPILETFRKWIQETWPHAPPKSPLGQALVYSANQWPALQHFLEDGRLELDNNACERALRTIAVGRKNWLFAGSDEGARRSAVIYTIVGTCRLNGVDPWEYVRDVLEKLAAGWLQSRIAELLPPNWRRHRDAGAAPAPAAISA